MGHPKTHNQADLGDHHVEYTDHAEYIDDGDQKDYEPDHPKTHNQADLGDHHPEYIDNGDQKDFDHHQDTRPLRKYTMTIIMAKCYEFDDHCDQQDNEDDADDEDE